MTVTVIDVSHYQSGLKLSDFKTQGGLAVIAKASQGATAADPSFADFRSQAAGAGLAFASYHYLTLADPALQASWFLSCARPVQGERIVCDWEADGVTAAMVVAFLKAVAVVRPDLELTVYGNSSDTSIVDAASAPWLSANTSLWIAAYTTKASPTYNAHVWKAWSLWQYADDGAIYGFAGDVDLNRFNGSAASCLKWFGPASAPAPAPTPKPTPAPAPTPSPVIIMTIDSDRPVTLVVNGINIKIA